MGPTPQYHTSARQPGVRVGRCVGRLISIYLEVVRMLESNRRYLNLNQKCEVRLGVKEVFIGRVGGEIDQPLNELATLWVLSLF